MMKNKYLISIVIFIVIIFIGYKAKYYIDCDFSLNLGGGPGSPRPAYCDAKQQKQDKQMASQFKQDYTFQCKIQEKSALSRLSTALPETQDVYYTQIKT